MMFEPDSGASSAPTLEDYLAAIRKRPWAVMLPIVLALALGWFYLSNRPVEFTAQARVLVQPTPVASTNNALVKPVLEREREVLDSLPIAEAVYTASPSIRAADDISEPLSLLKILEVEFQPDSDVLRLLVTGNDPEFVRDVANGFAQEYVDQRVGAANERWESEIEVLQRTVDTLDVQIAEVDDELALLRTRLADLESDAANERTAVNSQITALNQRRSSDITSLRQAEQAIAAVRTEQAVTAPPAEVLELAQTPQAPIGIGDGLTYTGAGLVGLLLGVAMALILDRLDNRASDRESVERALGAGVLASVPNLGARLARGAGLVMRGESKTGKAQAAREAYRRLRSSLQFLTSTQDTQAVIFTSSSPGEGKSTTAANLALALAQAGERVVLISADMRRPSLERYFGVDSASGLSNWLSNPTDDVELPTIEVEPNLFLIPAGPTPANPGEMLGSPSFQVLIDTLRSQTDVILIDTPPILNTADAMAAASAADGIVAVVDARHTSQGDLQQLRIDADRVGARLLGAVLNKERQQRVNPYRNRYSYERAAATTGS